MTKSSVYLWKMVMLASFMVVGMASAFGQNRECPLESYDGNWAWGVTKTFYVGEPFDGIGQVEVWRPGKPVKRHSKNRKWKLSGVPIKPGEVFTKAGSYNMTMASNGYETAYKVDVLPARGPKKPVAKVVSYPTQTTYKVGERFYKDGIKVVCHDANGNEIPVHDNEITFFTSISNTLVGAGTQCGGGYKFNKAGTKVIEVRYNYATIGKYTITVGNVKQKPATTTAKPAATTAKPTAAKTQLLAAGWYYLRTMNNYLNLDAASCAELRKKSVNQAFYVETPGFREVTLKMANGMYLGIADDIRDGVRLKAVSTPYIWNIYSENNADIFSLRPPGNTQMVVNASGEKNTNGTPIIIWRHTNFNAPGHAEFRFIPK